MSRLPRLSRRRTLALVAGGVVVWLLLAAWQLLGARSDLQDGGDALQAVRRDATVESMLEPETTDELDRADDHFASARRHLRSPFVSPLRALPVVGRQIRAADRVESTARLATFIAHDAVDELRELSERGSVAGPGRVALVRDLDAVVGRARARLADLDPGSPDALVGSLADAIDDLADERDDALAGLGRAQQATTAVADLLDGPGTYLLFGANNAEMRAGSGMFLSAAPLTIADGTMTLGDVRPVAELVLPAGQVPVDGDLAANWPWLDPGRDPRQLGLTADFPQSAAVAAEWWRRVPGGGPVDGVISVDVAGVRELLRVVGPVTVDGVEYNAKNVAGELLRGQYRRAGDDVDGVAARRDNLGEVARAVFAKIESGGWEVDGLATSLVELVQRRHLLVWSADDAAQKAWVASGVAGDLDQDTLSVAMLNRGAQKLDPFLPATAVITTNGGALDLRYTVRNEAPDDGPRYQIGPNIAGLVAGEHRGIVVVNVPAASTDLTIEGGREILRATDGPTEVIAVEVRILRGDEITIRVRATLPDDLRRLVLEPSARMPGTSWTVDGRTFEVDRRRTVPVAGR
jgi:hypothetical protein